MPPNSKGGAFIHDPKLAGEREVYAQVKLFFHSANDAKMITTRSMQLTLKKTASTFKTLEGNLVVIKDGHRQKVSARCAELESLMPLYLGVSKAILENVIFCHQEDSLWPLSEPTALKKKFDEIFEAQKFTKALDNIKVLRKEYANEIKMLQQQTDYLKADREKAAALEKDAKRIKNDISIHQETVGTLSGSLEIIVKKLEKLMSSKQTFRDILYELDYLQKGIEGDINSIAELRSSIKLLPQTESQLREEIENFGAKTQERRERVEEIEQSIQHKKVDLTGTRRHYNENILKEGNLQAAYESHLQVLANRSKAILQVCKTLDIPTGIKQRVQAKLEETEKEAAGEQEGKGIPQLDTEDYEELYQILEHLSARYQHELNAERNNNLLIENQHEQKVQNMTTERLQHEQSILNHERNVRQFTEKTAALKRTISSIPINESDVAYEEAQLADIEKSIVEANDVVEKISSGGEIQENENKLKQLSEDVDDLNEKLKIVNNESENRAKLGVLSEDLKKREKARLVLVEAKKQEFAKFGIDIDEKDDDGLNENKGNNSSSVEKQLRKAIEEHQKLYDQAIHELDSSRRELTLAESRLSVNTQKLESLQAEKKTLLDKIYSEIDFDCSEYSARVIELEAQEAELSSEIGQASFFKSLHQRAIQDAETHNRCLMCFREFQVAADKDGFLHIINEKEERIQNVDKLKTTYGQVVEAIKVLRSIAPSIERLDTLEQTLIPYDADRKEGLEASVKEQTQAVEAAKEKVQKCKQELESVEQLQRPASDLLRNTNELLSIKAQISAAKAQLITLDSNGSNSSETGLLSGSEILAQLGVKGEEAKRVRKDLDKLLETRYQARAKISSLQITQAEKTESIGKIRKQLETKTEAEAEIVKLEKERDDTNKVIVSERKLLEKVCVKLASLDKQKNEIKVKAAEAESKISSKYREVVDSTSELQKMTDLVTQYETSNGKEKLEECRSLVAALEEKINKIDQELEGNEFELKKAEKALMDLSSHERLLKDNLKLVEMEKEIQVKRERVEELELENAESEKIKFEEQTQQLRQQEAQLSSERAGVLGEMRQLNDQLVNVTTQLERDYQTTATDYKKSLLQLETTTLVNEDLAKYAKALDAAIMSYHSLKMREINRIVDDLWKKTYSGTDVDTILIKSENETSGRGGRTYNYRVCMVKQDVELDMRGRCSAGQKVLASIIIRLALAECFGVNCGLIALDEPTTNLDEDNIESLAKALNQIIAARQQQKNFQLIVITHDEKFLLHMNAAAYTDCFYRVSRNERQLSQIEWVPISRISE